MLAAAEELAVGSSFSSKAGSRKNVPADASPDSKCPICLDRFENVSYLDRCLHRFCFRCIQEWSKNKAECPLCKQPFYSIFHSVKAEDDFQEFVLRPSENGSFGSPDGRRFRYRSTLTRERRNLLNSRRSVSRTVSPPDNGILFEGLAGQPPVQRNDSIHVMIRRLASRRQASAEGRSMRQIQEQDIIHFRRALYRSGVRVRSIQDGGRFRDISSEFYRRNPACLHRLIPWLKRELTVLFGVHGSLVNIVQHIIMSNVTRYDLESQAFAEDVRPFLLHRTDHFLHELISFARCPYNMEAYDQHSNYDCPAPSYEEGSHSDSTVITISPDEAEAAEPDVNPSDLSVGQAPWDDETPGPSYSTIELGPTTVSSLSISSVSSDEETTADVAANQEDVKADPSLTAKESSLAVVEDCLIVGYLKPLAERTPELVELSSDSDASLYEMKSEATKKPEHPQFLFSDDSDTSLSSSQSSVSPRNKADKKIKHKGKLLPLTNSSLKKKKSDSKRSDDFLSSFSRDKRRSPGNHESQRNLASSRSSESLSHSSHGRGHRHRSKHHSKERLRSRSSRSRERIKKKDSSKNRLKSRDRSLSMRSQTVSITSGSSISRNGGSSRSRSRDRQRSRSRDHDYRYPQENYRSSYQWEYTYYSRNRDRGGYEESYRSSRGQYHISPDYMLKSYTERKNTWGHKSHSQSGRHQSERHRSRSRSSSRSRTMTSGMDWSRSEKPGGKRKYKTRHLENQGGEAEPQDVLQVHGKENSPQKMPPSRYNNEYSNEEDLEKHNNETKHKRRKKTRSPSIEIVYEGKATDTDKHRKKKKKKHKKKRRRHHVARSTNSSPVVITIDSDGDHGPKVEKECNRENACTTSTPKKGESSTATSLIMGKSQDIYDSLDEIDLAGTDDDAIDKDCDNTTSSGHLDAATGILDDFHFDESSNDQPLGAMEESDSSQSNESVLAAFARSAETLQAGPFDSPRAPTSVSPRLPFPTSPVTPVSNSPRSPILQGATVSNFQSALFLASASPHLSASASPHLSASASPHLSASASPHLSASASPHLSASASPHLSASASPHLSASASPHLSASASPHLSALASPHLSASASPHLSASSSPLTAPSIDAYEGNPAERPPLILTFPKRLMDTTCLFDHSHEKT
ncbi:E3 ubiquitin-protein ligase Topors isoform X2 [Lissotriton helveticus]